METTVFDCLYEYVTLSEWRCLLGEWIDLDARELRIHTASMLTFCEKTCQYKRDIAEAIVRYAPYDMFTLDNVKPYLDWDNLIYDDIFAVYESTRILIEHKRPMCFLAYYWALNKLTPLWDVNYFFCNEAVSANNCMALAWLRNPATGGGKHMWHKHHACAAIARGQVRVLYTVNDSSSAWCKELCLNAVEFGRFKMLRWLRNPNTGKGVYQWDKEKCLRKAFYNKYTTLHAWIERQPA